MQTPTDGKPTMQTSKSHTNLLALALLAAVFALVFAGTARSDAADTPAKQTVASAARR